MSVCEDVAVGMESRLARARQALSVAEARAGVSSVRHTEAGAGLWAINHADMAAALRQSMGRSGWAAVVACPDLGWLSLAQNGVDLGRVIVVPFPGERVLPLLSVFLDGVVAVVCGPVRLSAGQRSTLAARARQRGHGIYLVGDWPGVRRWMPENSGLRLVREGAATSGRVVQQGGLVGEPGGLAELLSVSAISQLGMPWAVGQG